MSGEQLHVVKAIDIFPTDVLLNERRDRLLQRTHHF